VFLFMLATGAHCAVTSGNLPVAGPE
jgi:hypothetical protein